MNDGGGVINHGIDPGDLLENRQTDADDQRRPDIRTEQLTPGAALFLLLEVGFNLVHLCLCIIAAADACEYVTGCIEMTMLSEPSWAFRQDQHTETKDNRRHHSQP